MNKDGQDRLSIPVKFKTARQNAVTLLDTTLIRLRQAKRRRLK